MSSASAGRLSVGSADGMILRPVVGPFRTHDSSRQTHALRPLEPADHHVLVALESDLGELLRIAPDLPSCEHRRFGIDENLSDICQRLTLVPGVEAKDRLVVRAEGREWIPVEGEVRRSWLDQLKRRRKNVERRFGICLELDRYRLGVSIMI